MVWDDIGIQASCLNFVLRFYQLSEKYRKKLISDMHVQNKKYVNNW